MSASINRLFDTAAWLLDQGADPDLQITDRTHGSTPEDRARIHNADGSVALIRRS